MSIYQFVKGLHNAFLEDIHVVMDVSIDNTNNDILFVETNFNPKGFTTIKRSRQFSNVFSICCVFNISTNSTFVVESEWNKVYPCI